MTRSLLADSVGAPRRPLASAEATHQPALTAKLSRRWALTAGHLSLVAFLGGLFLLFNYLPLPTSQLWGHVTYGKWIVEHRALPAEDPSMPLAEGMPVVDHAWLSEVILAVVEGVGGVPWLSHLFAVTMLATCLVLARCFYLQSGRFSATVIGLATVLLVGRSHMTNGPAMLGLLCLTTLLWLLLAGKDDSMEDRAPVTRAPSRPLWLATFPLFVLWANLHGSFVCGLAVLGCYLLGSAMEVAWRSRSLSAALKDSAVRRWFCLLELALVATLVNPYGVDLLLVPFYQTSLGNLRAMLEWQPLVILRSGGREFALSWVVLLLVLRHSRRRMPVTHALLLGVFSVAAVFWVAMLTWYAVVYAYVLVPHVADLLARLREAQLASRAAKPARESPVRIALRRIVPPGRTWTYSLLCLFVIWVAFALSPLGGTVLNQQGRADGKLLGGSAPSGLTEYLRANPPGGQVFHPQAWGDWLAWDGPEGVRPFVTSRVELLPGQVWQDYLDVVSARSGWQRILDRYRVETVIMDKREQSAQTAWFRREANWSTVYEDDLAVVFERSEPQAEEAGQSQDEPAPQQIADAAAGPIGNDRALESSDPVGRSASVAANHD